MPKSDVRPTPALSHNVSVSPVTFYQEKEIDRVLQSISQSLIAQSSEYPLVKPAGFHWDFFILGITTMIAGIFGIPAPNGQSSHHHPAQRD